MMLGYEELMFIKELPYDKVPKFEPPKFHCMEVYAIKVSREHES
jgi:hypothetical protein